MAVLYVLACTESMCILHDCMWTSGCRDYMCVSLCACVYLDVEVNA